MPKGPLREAIEDWIETGPWAEPITNYFIGTKERKEEIKAARAAFKEHDPNQYKKMSWGHAFTDAVYIALGLPPGPEQWDPVDPFGLADAAIGTYTKLWEKILSAKGPSEITQVVGALITEPVLQHFETLSTNEEADPKEGVRAFHSLLVEMSVMPGVVASALESVPGVDADGIVEFIKQLYWNFGIGFLGWQTLSPAMEVTIGEQLNRYYAEKFRPARFSASELRDLYALGRLSANDLRSEAAELGWRDADIQDWIDLAYRQLSQSDIWALYHDGHISKAEAAERLQALGYNHEDIPLLFQINQKDEIKEARSLTLSTARKAYRNQLIGAGEFRESVQELGRSEREANLLIAIEDQRIEQDRRNLTVSQIKRAYRDNILTKAEVRHWLGEEQFQDSEIDVLLRTWDAEFAPTFVKLTRTTIVGAYVEGILTRTEASGKLQDIGLRQPDASLELDLAEARNPEAFGAPPPKIHRYLTPGLLRELVVTGTIGPGTMREKLIQAGYNEEDAGFLAQAAEIQAQDIEATISQNTVERAYLVGVLSREGAEEQLDEIGFPPEDIDVILDTVEQENPAVFAPESIQSLRTPTITTLTRALQDEVISEEEYFRKALEIGYRRADAEMYIAIAKRQERKGTKTLSTSQALRAYEAGIISRGDAQSRLLDQGYNNIDTEILLRLERPDIEDTEVWKNLLAGMIQPEDAFAQLFSMGYSQEDINGAIEDLE